MNKFLYSCTLCIMFLGACSVSKQHVKKYRSAYNSLSVIDKQLADTLLQKSLENEGLYTLSGRLKPMSTVADLNLAIAQKDTLAKSNAMVTDVNGGDYKKLQQYQRIINALQFDDVHFIMVPFKIQRKGLRNISINVYRQSLVDSMVNANSSFYGQFAYVSGTPAPLLVNTTEYERPYDRFRSYGNLFGYPPHAVDFFVKASITSDETKEFVKRDFYNMPVYSKETGRFVYAIPKDSKPGTADETIKQRAAFALEKYRALRIKYVRTDGSVDYYNLFLNIASIGKK
ncbi:hypothetical protein ACVWYN_002807 [Pedobacter sp. UYP24]